MQTLEERPLGKVADMSLLRRLLLFAFPHKGLFFVSVVLVFVLTALDLAVPWITKEAIDRYLVPHPEKAAAFVPVNPEHPIVATFIAAHPESVTWRDGVPWVGRDGMENADPATRIALREQDIHGAFYAAFALLCIIAANSLLSFFQTFLLELGGQRIIHDIRLAVFRRIRLLSLTYFHNNPTGRLTTRVTGDVENLSEMFTSVVTFVVKDTFLLLGILGVLVFMDEKLSLISLLVLPLAGFAASGFARGSRAAFREIRVKIAEINARFAETIGGMTVIRLAGREKETKTRFAALSQEHYGAAIRQVRVFATFMPVIDVLNATSLALVIYFGGRRVLGETISIGVLVAYISYLRMFFRPVRDIAEKYNILQNAFSSAERLFQILDEPMGAEGKTGGKKVGEITTISFEDVTFGYDATPVLEGVNLAVHRGETIAIVGPTGAGKTSLVSLLVRFWDPDTGRIVINGSDLLDLDLDDWRSRIAMVMQDPFLFAGSIRENILPRNEAFTDSEMLDLLEKSGCGFVTERFSQGVDTVLSEDGKPLSSGERQLVSIARAFAKNPEILILDEATSYVDTVSEAAIQSALLRLMENRTTFLIAHRLSTARHADRIVVVHNRQIAETGSHGELMAQKGIYWRLQMLEAGDSHGAEETA